MSEFNNLQTENKKDRKLLSRVGWALTALLVFTQIGAMVISKICSLLFPKIVGTSIFTFLTGLVPMYLVGFPIFLFIMRKIPKGTLDEKQNLKKLQLIKLIIISLGTLYIFNMLSSFLILGIAKLKGSEVINPLSMVLKNANILERLIFIGILAPIMEEIIFRGIIISRLRKFGDSVCIFVSSFAFALLHGNLSQFFYAFALGCIFAYTVLRFGKIRYTILMHMIVNIVGSVLTIPIIASQNKILIALFGLFILAMVLGTILLFILNKQNIVLEEGLIKLTKKEKFKLIFKNSGMITYTVLSFILIIFITVAM